MAITAVVVVVVLLLPVEPRAAASLALAVGTAGLIVSAMVVPWDAVARPWAGPRPSGSVRREKLVGGGRTPLRVEGLG